MLFDRFLLSSSCLKIVKQRGGIMNLFTLWLLEIISELLWLGLWNLVRRQAMDVCSVCVWNVCLSVTNMVMVWVTIEWFWTEVLSWGSRNVTPCFLVNGSENFEGSWYRTAWFLKIKVAHSVKVLGNARATTQLTVYLCNKEHSAGDYDVNCVQKLYCIAWHMTLSFCQLNWLQLFG